jgi:hypothetical protein
VSMRTFGSASKHCHCRGELADWDRIKDVLC